MQIENRNHHNKSQVFMSATKIKTKKLATKLKKSAKNAKNISQVEC